MIPATQLACSRCGVLTEWDDTLGDTILCPQCWDKEAERGTDLNEVKGVIDTRKTAIAKYQKNYRLAHRAERKAYEQEYYRKQRG